MSFEENERVYGVYRYILAISVCVHKKGALCTVAMPTYLVSLSLVRSKPCCSISFTCAANCTVPIQLNLLWRRTKRGHGRRPSNDGRGFFSRETKKAERAIFPLSSSSFSIH